jgi:hypothetical protein
VVSAALAATLLLGYTTTFEDGKAQRTHPRFVDPTTLEGLPSSPRFPHDARVDVAPDGSRAAAVAHGRLSLYDLDTGKRTWQLPSKRAFSLSWIAPRRILVLGCRRPSPYGLDCSPYVTAVDTQRRRVLRTTVLRGFDTPTFSRVGRRQILVARRGSQARAFTFTAGGRLVRRARLPRGTGTISDIFITAPDRLLVVDPRTGRLRSRVIRFVSSAFRISKTTAVVVLHERRRIRFLGLDPQTLEVGPELPEGAGGDYTPHGWFRQTDSSRVALHGFDGDELWSRAVAGAAVGRIGDRIYVQDCEGPSMHVYDLATGDELPSIGGYWNLDAPTRGAWYPPNYAGERISPELSGSPC